MAMTTLTIHPVCVMMEILDVSSSSISLLVEEEATGMVTHRPSKMRKTRLRKLLSSSLKGVAACF